MTENLDLSQLSDFDVSFSIEDNESTTLSPTMASQEPFQREPPASRHEYAESQQNSDVTQRQVHLVTWSRADVLLLPTSSAQNLNYRKTFGLLVTEAFQQRSKEPIVAHWVSSCETQREIGYHFHVAIKLKQKVRCLRVAEYLRDNYGISANFLAFHNDYDEAYDYATKYDSCSCHSVNHRSMKIPPKTKAAISAKRRKSSVAAATIAEERQWNSQDGSQLSGQDSEEPPIPRPAKKIQRLNAYQVNAIIMENEIKDDLGLCALARSMRNECRHELAQWVSNHPAEKFRNDLIRTCWKMETSAEKLQRKEMTRLEILELCLEADHAIENETGLQCQGDWVRAALDILEKNCIELPDWQLDIKNCLQYGRKKDNNVFIIGSKDMGKTFMLQPLTEIYDTMCNPARGSFNLVGANSREVLFFNDFRYQPNGEGDRKIPWEDFLNLLDGNKIKIPAPKTFFAEDVDWVEKQPIFATGPERITRVLGGHHIPGETAQMDARWKYVFFRYTIPSEERDTTLIPCPRCFTHLILGGEDLENV